MRKRRIFLSILLIIVLLCPMYAAFADATESTVLTVACEEHEVELFDAAVMRFCEQHPGVEVRFEIMTTEQMDDALENGTNVDVFLTASNFTNLDRLVHRGLIAPLASETLLANMAKMYAPFRDYVTYQQQVYAYPREVLANTRTVNTELLRMYGSFLGEVPTTMSEYIEQMRKWYDTSITVGSDSSFTEQNMPETLLEYTLDELVIAYLCEYYQTDDTRGTYRDFSTSDFANMLDSLDFLRVAAFQMTEAEEKPWNAAAWGEKSGSLYTKVGFTPVVIGFEENEPVHPAARIRCGGRTVHHHLLAAACHPRGQRETGDGERVHRSCGGIRHWRKVELRAVRGYRRVGESGRDGGRVAGLPRDAAAL